MTGRKYCNENGISPTIMIQKKNGKFVQLYVLLNQFARVNSVKRNKWGEIRTGQGRVCVICRYRNILEGKPCKSCPDVLELNEYYI